MPIQRNHSRRRRVFLDESVQSEFSQSAARPVAKSGGTKSKAPKIYADAAKHEEQLKITDLIPRQNILIAAILVGCLIFVGALNYLAINVASWSEVLSDSATETLSFSGSGSLSSWFSSILLMMTSVASLQIYSMRRHRNDDYGGKYRIWVWLAVLFIAASVNCVVDFKSVFQSLAATTGYPLGKNILWLLGMKFLVLNLIIVRGLLEIRQSRPATVAVVLAWVAYSIALAVQLPFAQNSLTQFQSILLGNTVLFGNLSCFAVAMFFARFIYLHANEMVKIEPVAAKESKKAVDKTDSQEQLIKTRSVRKSAPKPVSKAIQKSAPSPKVAPQAEVKPASVHTKARQTTLNKSSNDSQEILNMKEIQELSKSERRRLKKLQKRQRRAA